MQSLKKQYGLTPVGWLFIILVFGFCLLAASKLGPHYLDNRFVVATLKELANDPAFPGMSPGEVKSKLGKTFQINNIRGTAAESVKVKRNAEGLLVSIQYEERFNFIKNIDVVLVFNSELDSKTPDLCCQPQSE